MAGSPVPRDEELRIKQAMTQAARAIQAHLGVRPTTAQIAHLTGSSEATVGAYQKGVRRPTVDFVRRLANVAGLPTSTLFVTLGWLSADEVAPADHMLLTAQISAAVATLARLEPHARQALDIVSLPAPALMAAMAAVLSDPEGASRFSGTMSQVISGERFRLVTNTVVEFKLRPDAKPLAPDDVEMLARQSGVVYRPDPALVAQSPDYWSVKLELVSRTHRTLQGADLGHYSWQGEPGTSTWLDAASQRPAHLLVQAPFGCVRRRSSADAWTPARPRTLVLVGGRYSLAHAAALLAEALGWEFVPVRRRVELTASGAVVPVQRTVGAGVLSWTSTAHYIDECYDSGNPWPAVVLLRPRTLRGPGGIDKRAVERLSRTPASLIYLRPPRAFVSWWAQRRRSSSPRPSSRTQRFLDDATEELDCVEEVLRARHGCREDLCLRMSEPDGPLPGGSAQIPAEIIDVQPDIASAVLAWLDESVNQGRLSIFKQLRPSPLTSWLSSEHSGSDQRVARISPLDLPVP